MNMIVRLFIGLELLTIVVLTTMIVVKAQENPLIYENNPAKFMTLVGGLPETAGNFKNLSSGWMTFELPIDTPNGIEMHKFLYRRHSTEVGGGGVVYTQVISETIVDICSHK